MKLRNKHFIITLLAAFFMSFLLTACTLPFLPESGDTYFEEGAAAYLDGDYITALEKLQEAEKYGVDEYSNGDLYTYIAHTYWELGLSDEAIGYYQYAVDEDPDEVSYVVNLAIAYRQCGDNETAKELYLQALEIDPNYAELHSSLGTLYIIENRPEDAIESFNKAIELNPNLAVAYGNAALAYAMVGDFETADEYLDMAIIRGYTSADVIRDRIEELK
ncbi:MAG: tetratricopeptide repeat protein [Lachnospiraceae bacterium]|nr:tetratricopeptide repeat protein [Lachnospiraceae bacterium]